MNKELEVLCKQALEKEERSTILTNIYKLLEEMPNESTLIWNYPGFSILLIQEITMTYYQLNTPAFTPKESGRICTVLNILQVLVPVNYKSFIDGQFVFFLYPFLNTSDRQAHYEALRISSLSVLCTLFKSTDDNLLNRLKNTEIVPLTLKIMDTGTEIAKEIAIYIFLKLIRNKEGLDYVCQTFERFVAISIVLNSMLIQSLDLRSYHLLRSILECYVILTSKENVRISFYGRKPEAFTNPRVIKLIEGDEECLKLYKEFDRLLMLVTANRK
ncbi:Cell differentiation protein rcd1 [Astathelohania contejeani]|uniref:Cell differentiation protein rcd1 n=1 Tax=Astathelohania contejeani TaxID=164912 RepID=A0ABQ7I2A9_9MICR|nr:Cell differentiation protein rcd1 [Thelohania contejeani]